MKKAELLCHWQSVNLEKERDRIRTPNYWDDELKSINDILDADTIPPSYKRRAIFYAVQQDKIELSDLRSYLLRKLAIMRAGVSKKDMNDLEKTEVRKLLCLYDEKKYS